jgi:hypothetical protein
MMGVFFCYFGGKSTFTHYNAYLTNFYNTILLLFTFITIIEVTKKVTIMETETAVQELLLNVNSSFCKREWCEIKDEKQQSQSYTERLKTLCWNGMIPELLPEVCIRQNNRPLILWEMMGLTNILHLKMGGYSERLNPEYALHPYLIMDNAALN